MNRQDGSGARGAILVAYARKALLAGGIALAVLVVALARPGDAPPPGREVVTLWQVTGAEDEEKPYVPRLFNDSQDRLYVQAVGLPFLEMEQKFLTAVVGNIPPDVFEYFGSVAQWSTRGALIPLDDLMDRDGFDRKSVFPALWDEMTWDGRTYAIPTGTSNEAFYWNREHFREAGLDPDKPPETWDELEDYALKLTTRNPDGSINRAGYIPGYWSPSGPALFLNWPLQMGAQFVSGDGRHATLATTAGIAALEWDGKLFERLGRDQLVLKRSSYGQGNQHGFLRGNLSMIVNKSSFVQEIERYAPGLDYGVSFLPYPKGGRRAVVAGCVWIGIPAGAKNPEAAWEYIKFCTNAAVQMRGAEYAAQRNLGGFFPANIEAAGSPFQMGLPHMKVFVDSMAFGHSPTVVPLAHTQFWRAYIEAWDAVTLGKLDAATALRKAESAVQRGLDEQWDYARFYNEQIRHTAPAGGRVQGEGFR